MKVIHIPQNPSPIKSIQRGVVNNTSVVNVAAVDMAKSILNISCKNGHAYGNTAGQQAKMGGGYISSPTTLNFEVGSAGNATYGVSNASIYWELIEYV